jgi:CheY-like chemotaxis protein
MGLAERDGGGKNRLNMANIVVIEDHPPVLKLLSTLCRSQGHEVMAFDNGRAGLTPSVR